MADLTPPQFAASVLRRLGIQPNDRSVRAMVGWMRAEGGHWNNSARYNPLNTTQNMPGSGDTGSQGNISVYRNWNQGIDATVRTLRNGRYGGIIQALRGGDPNRVSRAIQTSPWGTHNDIAGIIRGVSSVGNYGTGRTSSSTSPSTPAPAETATATVDPAARQQALLGYLENRHDPNALLGLASTLKSLQAVAPTSDPSVVSTGQDAGSQGTAGGGGLNAIVSEANRIDQASVPYQWGGGHAGRQIRGSKVTPLDCSGAVSRALGINPRVSGQFAKWGAPGEGSHVTIYANPTHVIMKVRVNGKWRFWGTSQTNPGGGAGWIDSSAISPQYLRRFTARHPPGL